MKTKIGVLFLFCSLPAIAQNTVDVAESTLKISGMGEEVFYFGFAQGDKLLFNFQELNGKELKELEIMELPSSSKFMDYKTNQVENKIININRTAIYQFRFANSALGGRICKIKIQRIPASDETKNFNTSVSWRTEYDTTYTLVEEKYLFKTDTSIINVIDQLAKVSSQTAINSNPNKTIVGFTLPESTASWSYYIGVGNEGKQAYEASKEQLLMNTANSVSTIPGYGAMAALALHGINTFSKVQGEDNVKYWFITDGLNAQAFKAGQSFYQYKQGDVVNDAQQMKTPLAGEIFIGLLNDNLVEPIEVVIKVTAIQIKQVWASRPAKKVNVTARQVAFLNN